MTLSTPPFLRDRLTWLAYAMLAYLGFSQALLGPLMPFLRSELDLSYTRGGFLSATLAMGLILSGLVGDRLARRRGRHFVFWSGALGLAASVGLLALSRRFELALIAVLGMGFGSSLTQVMIQAILSDRHGEQRSIALTEANVAASLSISLTPLVLGALQGSGPGWRMIPLIVVVFLALVAIPFFRQPIPEGRAQAATAAEPGRLPPGFWLYWMVLLMVVAIEMCIAVWGTEFLFSAAGFTRTDAVLAYSAFPAAMLIGRIAGSRLTRTWASLPLLLAALAVTLAGFPLFWLARLPLVNILGLFVTGLGVANLYPLTLSLAIGLAEDQSNKASARISLGVGAALLAAPLLLGWLADRLSLQYAYALVPVLIAAGWGMVLNQRAAARQRAVTGS